MRWLIAVAWLLPLMAYAQTVSSQQKITTIELPVSIVQRTLDFLQSGGTDRVRAFLWNDLAEAARVSETNQRQEALKRMAPPSDQPRAKP